MIQSPSAVLAGTVWLVEPPLCQLNVISSELAPGGLYRRSKYVAVVRLLPENEALKDPPRATLTGLNTRLLTMGVTSGPGFKFAQDAFIAVTQRLFSKVFAPVGDPAGTASGTVTGALLATGGLTSPSGAQSYGDIPAAGNVCRNYTFTVTATCGATVTATLQVQQGAQAGRNLSYTFPVGSLQLVFSENFDSVVAPALPAGWTTSTLTGSPNLWATNSTSPNSPPNRAFAADPSSISDNILARSTVPISAASSQLTFRHLYNVEASYDGGVLEIAIDAAPFQDIITAGGTFLEGAYSGTISTLYGSPIGGRQAWTGNSSSYVTTTVSLPPTAAGHNVSMRWRMASDSSVSGTGWSVDNVVLSSLQCGVSTTRRRGQITSN